MDLTRGRRKWPALIAGAGLAVALVVWLSPELAVFALSSWVRGETGRALVVERAEIHWGGVTTFDLRGVHLANARWAKEPWMMEIDHLRLRASLWQLLRGDGLVEALEMQGAALLLETNRGQANWRFADRPAPFMAFGGGGLPRVAALDVRDVKIRFHDPGRESDISGAIAGASGSLGVPGWRINGQGILDFKAISFQLQSKGSEVDVAVDLGDTSLLAHGTPDDGFTVHAQGADLRHAFPVIPIPFPSTPAYSFDARVVHDGARFLVQGLHGVLGDTDLSGELAMTLGSPPRVEGGLHSHILHLVDLKGFVGVPVRGPPPRPGKLFPSTPINRQRFSRLRLELDYSADEVAGGHLPMAHVATRIGIDRGVLRFDPLTFALADGPAEGHALLDVRGATPQAALQLQLDGGRLSQLLAHLPLLDASRGAVRGSLRLEGAGDSLADIFGASRGDLVLLMSGGALDRRFVDTLDGDLLQLLFKEGKPEQAPLSCAVTVFSVEHGVARADALVVETAQALITGTGSLDLRHERMDLTLAATPREGKPLEAPTPLTLGGTLAKPRLKLDTSELAGRAAAAVTLGALLGPLAAVAPFTTGGADSDGGCRELLQRIDGHG